LQAITDPLTGLPNRRGWDQQLAARIDDRRTRDVPLCLAVFDLDLFKAINDQHGHACGDAVLRTTGRALADSVRDGDLVARLGGDEFALAFRAGDLNTAQGVVERVRRAVEAGVAGGGLPAVTASAGFSLAVAGTRNEANKLFEAADAALRRAKKSGRNTTAFQPCGS
jgi:diguanylate cyclase (GGDEF)-like protein